MKEQKNKPTTYEIVGLVIKALTGIAALITAIRWW